MSNYGFCEDCDKYRWLSWADSTRKCHECRPIKEASHCSCDQCKPGAERTAPRS